MLNRRKFLNTTTIASGSFLASTQFAWSQFFNVGEIVSGVVSSAISNAISNTVQQVLGATMFVAEADVSPITDVAIGVSADMSAPKRMFTSHGDGSVALWDLKEGRQIKRLENLHDGAVNAVSISKDDKIAVSVGQDGTAQVLSASTGKHMATLSARSGESMAAVTAVAVSDAGDSVVTGHGDGTLRVWNVKSAEVITQVKPGDDAIGAVALSKDGSEALSGDAKGRIVSIDSKTGQTRTQPIQAHQSAVTFVQVSTAGGGHVTAGADGRVKFWKTGISAPEKEVNLGSPITSASLDAKNNQLGASDGKGTLTIVDLKKGSKLARMEGMDAGITAVDFGTGDKVVHAVASDGTMDIVNIGTQEKIARVVTTTEGWAAVDGKSGAFVGEGDALTAI